MTTTLRRNKTASRKKHYQYLSRRRRQTRVNNRSSNGHHTIKRVENGERIDNLHNDGWIRITIRGAPYERGFAHGQLAAHLFPRVFHVMNFICKEGYGRDIDFFYEICSDFFQPIIENRFPKIFK